MKSQHPDFQTEKKKADKGGFCADGKYLCHEQTCDWRGSSRSTRAAHMKREHPGYLNPMYQPKMVKIFDLNFLTCFFSFCALIVAYSAAHIKPLSIIW